MMQAADESRGLLERSKKSEKPKNPFLNCGKVFWLSEVLQDTDCRRQ